MELMLLFAAAILLLWLLASRQRDRARIERLESSVDHLFQAGSSVAHRVSSLESRGSYAPPPAYRTAAAVEAASIAPVTQPLGWRAGPPELVAPSRAGAPAAGVPSTNVRSAAQSPPAQASLPPRPDVTVEQANEPVDDSLAKPTIEWERWIGVRGAAALGAGILVIALFFFLRHSIAVGWLTLELRVALGALVGAGCVALAQLRLRGLYPALASWLTGAGVAGLYASIWAAATVASLIGPAAAFVLVVLVTAGCVALALRNDSLPTALLGAAGGFAAPLMLSHVVERPIVIVAYVLVLDVAMILLASKRRWWSLSALSMLLSAAYEAVWVSAEHSPGTLLQFGVLTVFAGVFGGVPALALGDTPASDGPPPPLARVTRYGAVIVPLAFAAWLARDPEVTSSPASLGGLLIVITVLSATIARTQREAPITFVTALGAPAVLVAWMANADVAAGAGLVGLLLALLAAVHVGLVAVERRSAGRSAPVHDEVGTVALASAVLFLSAALGLTAVGAVIAPSPWVAHLATGAALVVIVLALAKVGATPSLASLASLATPVLALSVGLPHGTDESPAFFAFAGGLALLGVLAALGRRASGAMRAELRSGARRGALVCLLALAPAASTLGLGVFVALALGFGLVALTARHRDDRTYLQVLVLLAVAMTVMTWMSSEVDRGAAGLASIFVCGAMLAVPLLPAAGMTASVLVPRSQVLGAAAFLAGVGSRFFTSQADRLGLGAAGLALVALVLYTALRRVTSSADVRHEAARWLGGATIALTSSAIGLSLENELLTWGWAALGLLLTWLASRRRSDALAVVGVLHLVLANTRVFANPDVLTYHPRGSIPVLNWITPTFLIPALAAALGWAVLSRMREADGRKHPLRVVPATLALVTLFAWANVAVLDVFSTGARITLEAASQARDLSMSLVWAAFGTALLILGMRRGTRALRWSSLVLVLATAGKVFLADLRALEDLYRVASLVGLAVSLLGISLLYQRFVFRARAQAA